MKEAKLRECLVCPAGFELATFSFGGLFRPFYHFCGNPLKSAFSACGRLVRQVFEV